MALSDTLQLLALVGVPIFGAAFGLLVYRIRALQGALDRHDDRLDAADRQIAWLKAKGEAIESLGGDIDTLHRRVDSLIGALGRAEGAVEGLGRQVTIVTQHLIGESP